MTFSRLKWSEVKKKILGFLTRSGPVSPSQSSSLRVFKVRGIFHCHPGLGRSPVPGLNLSLSSFLRFKLNPLLAPTYFKEKKE